MSELVSAPLFLVLRENTAKFAQFGLETTIASGFRNANSKGYHHNSLAAKTGKIWGRTGNRGCNNKERGLGVGAVCSTPSVRGTRRHSCSRPEAA